MRLVGQTEQDDYQVRLHGAEQEHRGRMFFHTSEQLDTYQLECRVAVKREFVLVLEGSELHVGRLDRALGERIDLLHSTERVG